MGKTWWVGDDGVRDKRPQPVVHRVTPRIFGNMMQAGTVTRFVAAAPAAREDRLHFAATLGDGAAAESINTGDQALVLDHEGHELCGVAADAEEFEALLEDGVAEGEVGCEAHTVAASLEHLT